MDGYIRVSRVGGRSGDSFQSPAKQRDEIETWAKLRGVTIAKWHEDLDISGKTTSRPGLDEAMRRVETGESDGIVVAKLSRFGRSVPDGLKLVKRVHDAGGKFAAIDLGIDPTTSTGKLVLTFMLGLAEWEHERLSAEWEAVRENAHRDGVHLATAPVGYTKEKRGKLTPDPVLAPVVVECFERRAAGASLSDLSDYLREHGVKMGKTGVRAMLSNVAYLGEASGNGGKRLADSHEPVVTREQFDAAQTSGKAPIHNGTVASQGMLTRIIKCAGCGRAVGVGNANKRKDGTQDARYFCRGYSREGRCPSPAGGMVPLVDDAVREAITIALVDGTLKATQDAIRRYTHAADAVAKAQAAYDALASAALLAEYSPEELARMRREQREVLDAAKQALAEVPKPDSVIEPDSLLWDRWDIEDERAFARQVISEVRLRRGGKGRSALPIRERIEIRWAGHDDFDTTVFARGAEARETAARLRTPSR